MDRPLLPTPDGFRLAFDVAGEVWSWRLTTPDGASVAGQAPDRNVAHRSAAITASVMDALKRTQSHWF
jgi:hypothetical protein